MKPFDAIFSVECGRATAADGWHCLASFVQDESHADYAVSVSKEELRLYAPGHSSPETLVRESFMFLLEREPQESILRRFTLSDIERYFPEYRAAITVVVAETLDASDVPVGDISDPSDP